MSDDIKFWLNGLLEKLEKKEQEDPDWTHRTAESSKEFDELLFLKELKGLTPFNDDFMRVIYKDNLPLTQETLRIILGKPDLKVLRMTTQKDLKRLAGGRSLVIDIWAVDSEGRIYDIEIQRDPAGLTPRRARYHASVMDVESFEKSDDFEFLPDVYTIFIMEKDDFGAGKPVYEIQHHNMTLDQPFEDGQHILYVNGEYRSDSPFGQLMHDFSCSDPNEMYNEELKNRVRFLKSSPRGVEMVSKEFKSFYEIGEHNGVEKGSNLTKRSIAMNLLEDTSLPISKIAEVTKLPVNDVEEISKSLHTTQKSE